MKFGLVYCLLGLILVQTTFQQTEEVVVTLDPEGESLEEFENQVLNIAKSTFEKLASAASTEEQNIINDFSGKIGLSVANVVIFVNNAGIDDVDESAQSISAALETALQSALSSSPPIYNSLNFSELTSTVEDTVTSVLKQLKGGKGINDVISQVANGVAKSTFKVVQEFVSSLSDSFETKSAIDNKGDKAVDDDTAAGENFDELDPAVEIDGEAVEEVSKEVSADVTDIYENGKFKFTGSGKTVTELQDSIVSLTETGFVKIENSNDPYTVANEFAVNITYFVGEVLLTVLNAENDVDKETEAEAISDAVGSALGVGIADSMGPLQMLDANLIQNEIVAATFNAITSADEPNADIDAILQKASTSILEILVSALTAALDTESANGGNVEVEEPNGDIVEVEEPNYQVLSSTDVEAVQDVETVQDVEAVQDLQAVPQQPQQQTQNTVVEESAPSAGGVLQVGSDANLDQTQEQLSAAVTGAFLAIESDPTASSNQAVVGDMLMAIAQAIGETIVSLTQKKQQDQISQTLITQFCNAIEAAIGQAKGPVTTFDINGVVKSIGTGVSEVFADSTENSDMGTQIQQVAGIVINIIVEELTEVVPGFSFSGSIQVVANGAPPSSTNDDDSTAVQESTDDVDQLNQESAIVAKSAEIPEDQQIAIDKSPLPVNDTDDTTIAEDFEVPANLPTQGDCLCFDEELFDAMVSAKVQEEIMQILKENQLI